MIIKLRQVKVQIVVVFLAVFTSILVCTVLCDLDAITLHDARVHSHDGYVQEVGDTHSNAQPYPVDDHHATGELANCCEDLAEPVMASLFYQKISPQKLGLNLSLLYAVGTTLFSLLAPFGSPRDKLMYFDLPPPLKGFDIRIYIQSFLN
jgi:hypothetical protein